MTEGGRRMLLAVNDLRVELREGTVADVPLLLSFIRSMAELERLTVTATEESLRTALFGDAPAARVLFAYSDGEPIAYVTYCFTFATMVGRRSLWLDDLFVVPAFRGMGIGKALMAHLAALAIRHRCARFEWMVLEWNEPAIGFYERLGASPLADWRICRVEAARLAELAGNTTPG